MTHRSSADGPTLCTNRRCGYGAVSEASSRLSTDDPQVVRAQPVHEPALPMDETVRETLEVAQLPFIDKVVDILGWR